MPKQIGQIIEEQLRKLPAHIALCMVITHTPEGYVYAITQLAEATLSEGPPDLVGSLIVDDWKEALEALRAVEERHA